MRLLTFIALLLLAPIQARAQASGLLPQNDLSKLSCKSLLGLNFGNTLVVLAFLQARYQAKDAPPVLDTNKMSTDGLKIRKYCEAHPQQSVIETADKLFGVRL